jgi:hypothetical protein
MGVCDPGHTKLRQRRDDGDRDRATAHPHQAFT